MTTPVAVTPLDEIVAAIVPRFAPAAVILFGSRARGDHRDDSDHDIMVVLDEASSRSAAEIHRAVSQPGRPVDVIVTTTVDFERRRTDVGTLEFVADREGRLLYERQPPMAHRLVREPPAVPESFAEWVERAESDFLTMGAVAGDSRLVDATTFHAHQCVEKYLKATLVRRGVPPRRTHLLGELLQLLDAPLRANTALREASALLDELWPNARYPENRRPTADEAASAADAARVARSELGFMEP